MIVSRTVKFLHVYEQEKERIPLYINRSSIS
jgi:hypothetical protein